MKILTIFLFLLMVTVFRPDCVLSGQIKIWTDEDDVTHIEIEGYKPPSQTEKPKVLYQIEKQESKLKRKREIEELERQHRIRQMAIEKELENNRINREKNLEKKLLEMEIEKAENEYKYLKSREKDYKRYYRDASSNEYRNYWKEKLDSIDEARKKHTLLKHRRLQK